MEIVLLVGAAPHALSAADARWLEQAIRQACLDDAGRPLATDVGLTACVELADVLHEDLERGSPPEPIELGWHHAKGLLMFVLRDEVLERSDALAALYEALLRFRGQGI